MQAGSRIWIYVSSPFLLRLNITFHFLGARNKAMFSAGSVDLAYLTHKALAEGLGGALLSALCISGKGERTVSPTPVEGSHAAGPAGLFNRVARAMRSSDQDAADNSIKPNAHLMRIASLERAFSLSPRPMSRIADD